ncbi:MAG TPA: hypothetical protein VHA57_04150, partial [Actinomycetota bacterium]|nr:hypothetical protein [Actinomycetota bacterium]
MPTSDAGYLEHLTATDLRTLAELELPGAESFPLDNSRVDQLLAHPAVFERLFGAAGSGEVFAAASPFLVFAVLVHRVVAELERSTFVVERAGERSRLPVFDVGPLRSFVADPVRRLFLVELLASYTKVHSGVVWVQSDKGWRRQRFSELDPIHFAMLLDSVPAAERPGIFRRLGDIALFLCGVFPDQAQRLLAGPVALRRLQQLSVGLAPPGSAAAG